MITSRVAPVLRDARRLLTVRLVAAQIGLALLLLLLGALWLRIPDASIFDVLGTVLLGLLLLLVAGAGQSWLVLPLCGRATTRARLLRGVVLLLAAVAFWFAWNALLQHGRSHDSLWAGYGNSQAPRGLRNLLSYDHLYTSLEWLWTVLAWIGVGVLAPAAVAGLVSAQPIRALGHILRSLLWWLALLIGIALATFLTGLLVHWVPGHGLGVEMTSLLLRLALVLLLHGVMVSALLALMCALLQRAEGESLPLTTTAGTPLPSQPRTVESP